MNRKLLARVFSVIVALVSIHSPLSANQYETAFVSRAACENVVDDCRSPYTFSDFTDYAKFSDNFPNGNPGQAYLNADVQVGPSDLRQGDIIRFNAEGELIEIISYYWRKIAGLPVAGKTSYPVHGNGSIASISVNSGQLINETFYPTGTNISLDRNGQVQVDSFYPDNPVSSAEAEKFVNVIHRVDEAIKFAKITAPEKSQISVDTDGNIRSIKLAQGQWNAGVYYPHDVMLAVNDKREVQIQGLYERLKNDEKVETRGRHYLHILENEVTLGAITLPSGTLASKNNGKYTAAHLFEKTNICGIAANEESISISHYNNGTFTIRVDIDGNTEIQGITR